MLGQEGTGTTAGLAAIGVVGGGVVRTALRPGSELGRVKHVADLCTARSESLRPVR